MPRSVQMHADSLIHDLFENGGISIIVVCRVVCCVSMVTTFLEGLPGNWNIHPQLFTP